MPWNKGTLFGDPQQPPDDPQWQAYRKEHAMFSSTQVLHTGDWSDCCIQLELAIGRNRGDRPSDGAMRSVRNRRNPFLSVPKPHAFALSSYGYTFGVRKKP